MELKAQFNGTLGGLPMYRVEGGGHVYHVHAGHYTRVRFRCGRAEKYSLDHPMFAATRAQIDEAIAKETRR